MGDVQNAVKTSKAADAQSNLSIDLTKAQIEAANSETEANSKVLNSQLTDSISSFTGSTAKDGTQIDGGAYNDAVSSISTAGKLTITQQNSLQGAVQTALAGGDTAQAKNAIKVAALSTLPAQDKQTVTGLETVASAAYDVLMKLQQLPADQQTGFINGNLQQLATKFGQNPDPKLQTFATELTHFGNIYKANVLGKRAVTSTNGTTFNIPGAGDSSSLVGSDLTAIINTSNDYLKGTLSSVIDSPTYDSIFNAPQASSTASSTVTMTGPGGTFSVPAANVSIFTQNGYTQQ